jgi:hypothetical protein
MPSLAEIALARWFAHGVTSRTHPVLHCALLTFFHPLGIEAESLEAEPFSAIESGLGEFWLRRPLWNPARFDAAHPGRKDFAPVLERPEFYLATVDSCGILRFFPNPAAGENASARAFLEDGEQTWSAIRHCCRAAAGAETFIFAAAGLLLASDPIAEIYIQGNDAEFCKRVDERMRASREP